VSRASSGLVRWYLLVSSGAVVFVGICVAGSLTNWFRYPLSGEATFVVVRVCSMAAVSILLHVWALRTTSRSPLPTLVALASLVVVVLTAGITMKEAYGSVVPRFAANHIDKNGDQVVRTRRGRTVHYHLELENPFTSSAKAYLVGTIDQDAFRVLLPLESLAGYGEALTPSDWITLKPSGSGELLIATVTVDPTRTQAFTVDLDRRTVVPLR
jgi:hypothetical protein